MAIKEYIDKSGVKLFEVYVTVRNPHGGRSQIRRRGLPSRRQAEMQEFEIKRSLCDKRENPLYNWEEWHKVCVDRMRLEMEPSTVENYELRLKKWVHPAWKGKLIQKITPLDVHDLIFKTIQDVSENSRKTILKMIKRIFQMAIEEGILERNPCMKIKVKVPDVKQAVLNTTEVDILLREAKATGHRFYEIWAVALFTGMRSGELYGLKWTDIDFENRRITVSRSWCSLRGFGPTKTAKNRVVPVSVSLEKLLKEMKMRSSPKDEFVLPHLWEWTNGEQARITREFCTSIGITPVKFHDLRATFITQLLLKGVSLAQVMAMVGHSQLKTTNGYLRMAGTDLNGATDKLNFSLPSEQLAKIIEFDRRS